MARGTKRGSSSQANGATQTNGVHADSSQNSSKSDVPEPIPPSEVQRIRQGLDESFVQFSALAFAVERPPPTETGDGSYVPKKESEPILKTLTSLRLSDIKTLNDLVSSTVFNEPWDDRQYLLERIVKAAVDLPVNSTACRKLTDALITALYKDLQHPPQSYLGRDNDFRAPDGSNCVIRPGAIGAAGTPYARTVSPTKVQPSTLPDPGLIFDSIFKREEGKDEPHPNKISSMLFYLATIIIHDLFRTSHDDPNISQTSSYLDLAPLYGSNRTEQQHIRTFKDGKLKPDCFSEKRILGFPPGVGAMLIMFNRFHNHVVENLAAINEDGRFTKPARQGLVHSNHHVWAEYDERLFQTGRLVTCGLYINIILMDYVRTILNLNRTESNWKLDPRADIQGGPPRGTGNQVSAEFNLIYRWHSTISPRDAAWIEDTYKTMFDGQDPAIVPMPEMLSALGKMEESLSDDPFKRPFANLERGSDQAFHDEDLVKILVESTEDCANSFGAKQVPAVLRAVEILGMKQARNWGMSSLNEFRQHFNLKPYHTFEEINPDIAGELRHLYDTPDHVELYPGLVCEATKRAELPGSGLMPGYTTSRAILSDAVALVRCDRFYTIDYTPKALTNWGYAEASSNPAFDHGCVFYKLFNTAFPDYFEYNSIYAHYPLTIPSENRVIMNGLGKGDQYTFDRPTPKPKVHQISSYAGAMEVLNNKRVFGVVWGQAMTFLMGPPALNFMLAGDGQRNEESRKMMQTVMYPAKPCGGWQQDVKDFYLKMTRDMLYQKSYRLTSTGKRRVDLIRDVSNLVHVHFCAEIFCLPLKDDEHPHGVFTEQELYVILAAVFICVFFDADPVHSYEIHQMARQATQQLGKIVEENVQAISKTGAISRLIQYFYREKEVSPLSMYGVQTIKGMLETGMPVHELVWGHILGTAGGMVPNQGQLFSELLDFYLNDPIGQKYWPDVVKAAKDQETPDNVIMRYMLEGSRLSCGSAVMRKVRQDTTVQDGGKTIGLKESERVFVNMWKASRDPKAFPHPEEIRLDRDIGSYVQLGAGPHKCLGFGLVEVGLTAMLRVVASLPGLRPVAGDQGKIKKIPAGGDLEGYFKYVLESDTGASYFPFPMSMKVEWDDEDDDYKMEWAATLERRKTLPLLSEVAAEAADQQKHENEEADDRDKKPGRKAGARKSHGGHGGGHGGKHPAKRQKR